MVVTSYYNPERYRSKRLNLELFSERLEQQRVAYTIVECAFQGAEFELPNSSHILKIRASDLMWQKERLLNLAIESVAKVFTSIAWLDCDVLLEDQEWSRKTVDALQTYNVIQPFNWSVRLPKGEQTYRVVGDISSSFAWISSTVPHSKTLPYKHHGRTGFAWAARRSLLDVAGLYDCCIMGGADHVMAHVFADSLQSRCLSNFWRGRDASKRHFDSWAEAIEPMIRIRGLGALEGRLLHLWHGDPQRRSYGSRQNVLRTSLFDPVHDLTKSPQGPWAWATHKPPLHTAAGAYFTQRDEDRSTYYSPPQHATGYSPTHVPRSPLPSSIEYQCDATASRDPITDHTCVIYELNAWSGFMLPRIFTGASRISAHTLEPIETLLDRLPKAMAAFAFHINLTDSRQVPLCRTQLCNYLRSKNVLLLNSEVVDISKRHIQQSLENIGLPTLRTSAHIGLDTDLVIVKTNRNHGGVAETRLTPEEYRALDLAQDCPLHGKNDYRVLRRGDVPQLWWSNATLAIERYVSSTVGLRYRSYFLRDRHAIVTMRANNVVTRLGGSSIEHTICTTHSLLAKEAVFGLPQKLQSSLHLLTRYLNIDFGAVDFLQDDSGAVFIIDVNTTTYARGLGDDAVRFLREGVGT
jgi:hypothetical protein